MSQSFRSLITQAYTKSSAKRTKGKGQHKQQPRAPRVVPRVDADKAYSPAARAVNDRAYKKDHPTSRS